MDQSVKVYCLSPFTEEEEEDIIAQLSESNDQYSDVELIPWEYDDDGSQEDIFRLFTENRESQDDFMFFVDRESLNTRDFIVADGRAAQSSWFIQQTLQQYGYSYSDSWYKDTKLRNIIANAGVPFGRCQRSSYGGIRSTYQSFANRQVSFEQVVKTSTIQYSYTTNTTYTQQVLSRQVQQVQQNSSYSSFSSNYSQNESNTSNTYDTRDYDVSNPTYSQTSGTYQDNTSETEYRNERLDIDYSANRYTSDSRYDDDEYQPRQSEICDALYEDERKKGYIQDEDDEYSYTNTSNHTSYGDQDRYDSNYRQDQYDNTNYSGYGQNDGGRRDEYINNQYEDRYDNRQQYDERY